MVVPSPLPIFFLALQMFASLIEFTVEPVTDKLRCVACGSRRVIRKGGRRRRFRGLPIGRRQVWLQLRVPRLGCKECGTVRQAEITLAHGA